MSKPTEGLTFVRERKRREGGRERKDGSVPGAISQQYDESIRVCGKKKSCQVRHNAHGADCRFHMHKTATD